MFSILNYKMSCLHDLFHRQNNNLLLKMTFNIVHYLRTVMPAGDYYFGDPSYILPDETLKLWEEHYDGLSGIIDVYIDTPPNNWVWRNHTFAVGNTMYGNGCYDDITTGFMYPVDSGALALIPVNLADRGKIRQTIYRTSITKHTFRSPVEVYRMQEGQFVVRIKGSLRSIIDVDTDTIRDAESERVDTFF